MSTYQAPTLIESDLIRVEDFRCLGACTHKSGEERTDIRIIEDVDARSEPVWGCDWWLLTAYCWHAGGDRRFGLYDGISRTGRL